MKLRLNSHQLFSHQDSSLFRLPPPSQQPLPRPLPVSGTPGASSTELTPSVRLTQRSVTTHTHTQGDQGTECVCNVSSVCMICVCVCVTDGFYLPASFAQLPLHPPSAPSTAPSSSTPPQRSSRDPGRERHYRGERDREREHSREEQRPHSVVDLTQDGRSEDERRGRSGDRDRDRDLDRDRHVWPQSPQSVQTKPQSTVEHRARPSPPRPTFPSGGGGGGGGGRFHGLETDRGGRDEESRPHILNNSNSDRQRRSDSAGPPYPSYPHPPPALLPSPSSSTTREPIRELRVSAPTYVPSVEVYDERAGPIQIASQARDNKQSEKHRERERDRNRERESYRFPERSLIDHSQRSGDFSNQREEGSVICPNGLSGKRDSTFPSSQSHFSPDSRDAHKHSLRLGIERAGAESKWTTTISPLANYATSHMAALAAQHGHTLSPPTHTQISPHTTHRPSSNSHSTHSHSPQTHSSPHTAEDGGQRRYLDPAALYRPGGERAGGGASDISEVSAMQSLIKYSGNFPSDSSVSSSHPPDGRGPFGGLGHIGSEERERERERARDRERDQERERERDRERERERDRVSAGSGASGSLRVPPQLKREQERPDSARSFGREGEGEVRHPPVGIAVAVARQRDIRSSKLSTGPSDTQRTLLQTAIKGKHADCLSGGDAYLTLNGFKVSLHSKSVNTNSN